MYRFPDHSKGTCFQQTAGLPVLSRLDLGLVGLVGNRLLIEQLLLLLVEQLLFPKKSLEEVEVTHVLSRI